MPFFYLLGVAVAVAIAIFALQNTDQVTISFIAWKVEKVPLAAVILISGGVGGFVMTLVGWVQRWRLRAKIRQLEARQRSAEPEKPGG